MTAVQIIEEIKGLPREEREEIVRAVQSRLNAPTAIPTIRYASQEEVKRASAVVFDKYADLFRKLAQ